MYTREIEKPLLSAIKQYRCLTIIGPRQSGKTTLCKKLFPEFAYFSFEDPETRERFEFDPKGFFRNIKNHTVFDEVQKIPEILSYLQAILDDKKDPRKFLLTGSNNLKISESVSQSLAGRTRIFELLPRFLYKVNPHPIYPR